MDTFFYEFNNKELKKIELENKPNIEGEPLESIIENKDFSKEDIFILTNQLLEILDDMRSVFPPTLHKNINISNIIVKDNLDLALINFGSKNEGYELYTAPETLVYPTPKSDLYSVGVVLISILLKSNISNIENYDKEKVLESIDFDENFIKFIKTMTEENSDNRFRDIKTAKAILLKIEDNSITENDWDTKKANNIDSETLEYEDRLHNELNEALDKLDSADLRRHSEGVDGSLRTKMTIFFIIIVLLIIFVTVSR